MKQIFKHQEMKRAPALRSAARRRAWAVMGLGLAFAACTGSALAQPVDTVQGAVEWKTGSEELLRFEVKSGFGLYTKQGDSVQLTVYGTALSPELLAYALRRQALLLSGKIGGFKADAALDAKLRAASLNSAALWAKLSDVLVDDKAPRGTQVTAKDLRGLGLCISFNCRLHSGGLYGEDWSRQVKQLRFPLVMPQTAQPLSAEVELDIRKNDSADAPQRLRIKGSLPFRLIEE